MLRIDRVARATLSERALKFVELTPTIKAELRKYFAPVVAQCICNAQVDGEYINFLSEKSGSVSNVQSGVKSNLLPETVQKISDIKNFITNSACPSVLLREHQDDLIYFLDYCTHSFVINGNFEVLALFETKDEALMIQKALEAAATVPATVKTSHHFSVWCLLLPLLLFFILISLWWFLVRPWPFTGDFANTLSHLPPSFSYVTDEEQQAIDDLNSQLKSLQDKLKEEQNLSDADKAVLEQQIKDLNSKLDEANTDKQKSKDEILELKRLNEQLQKELEEFKKAKTQEPVKNTVVKKSEPSKKVISNINDKTMVNKPLCKVLEQKKAFPRLIIGFDGSGSMLENDYDFNINHNRLNLAKNAVAAILPKIDKRVSVGIVEINGCPLAINRGMFPASNQGQILGIVNSIFPNPNNARTPLGSGLMAIGNMASDNADDVGVLITDGLDTCNGPEMCSLARSIHKMKPNLKIHLIAISDSSLQAKCVADITGGKVYTPRNVNDFSHYIQELSQDVTQGRVCRE